MLLIVIGLMVLEVFLWNRKKKLIAGLFPGELTDLMFKNWNRRKHVIKQGLFALAVLFLILALARPQWGKRPKSPDRWALT